MELFEDGLSGGGPGEWLALLVVVSDEVIALGDQLFDRGEGAVANALLGDDGEEAFDLVEPGVAGRDEVRMPARMRGQPGVDLRMLVAAVVVDDAMYVQVGGDGLVDFEQESQELLMPMPRLARCQN